MTTHATLTVPQIAKALEEAGVISDIDSILRIVIELDPAKLPEIHIQRVGDKRLLGIVPMLAGAQVIERAKAVRYWVQVADELMRDAAFGSLNWPSCLRPVRPDELAPAPDNYSRWWLFEDDDAPPELDGKRVELTLGRGQTVEGGPYETRIERRVVA
jgi:hypothetical protein